MPLRNPFSIMPRNTPSQQQTQSDLLAEFWEREERRLLEMLARVRRMKGSNARAAKRDNIVAMPSRVVAHMAVPPCPCELMPCASGDPCPDRGGD